MWNADRERHWRAAPAEDDPPPHLCVDFLRDEIDLVIEPQGVRDLEAYLKASRIGRNFPLSRRQKREVWAALEANAVREWRCPACREVFDEPNECARDRVCANYREP